MRPRKKRMVYAIIPLLFLLGISEFFLRAAGYGPGKTYMEASDGDPRWEDPELFWTPPGAFAKQFDQTAKYGRGNLVYCFGGSIVQGFTVRRPFPAVLRKLLREKCSENAGVVNWAAQGYTIYQSAVIAKRAVLAAPPRVMIVSNAWNDHEIESYSDLEVAQMNRSAGRRILFVMNRSVAFAQMRRLLLGRDETKRPGEVWPHRMKIRVPLPDYKAQLKNLVALAKSAEADLILLSQAQSSESQHNVLIPYHEAMREAAESSAKVHFVDIRPVIEEMIKKELGLNDLPDQPAWENSFILDMCHPTEKGHRIIAEALLPVVCGILGS